MISRSCTVPLASLSEVGGSAVRWMEPGSDFWHPLTTDDTTPPQPQDSSLPAEQNIVHDGEVHTAAVEDFQALAAGAARVSID